MQSALKAYLETMRNELIHYCPNGGNAGDALIAHATFQCFDRMGLNYTVTGPGEDLRGCTVIYGGGGNFLRRPEGYTECRTFIARHHREAKKLVLLPHTIDSNEDLLSELGGNTTLICREETSYAHAKKAAGGANIMLMDDVALSTDVKATLRYPMIFPSYLLDREAASFAREIARSDKVFKTETSRLIRSMSSKGRNGPGGTVNCLRLDGERTDISIPGDNIDLTSFYFYMPLLGRTKLNRHLTHRISYRLMRFLSMYDEINTNRLHVCIAGAILGKRVNLYANNYYKNRAVYEYSLKDRYPNVHWVDR